jgi:putative hemolysin
MIILYLFICLIFAGFFAGLETGLLTVNRLVLQEKKKKHFSARAAEFLISKPERLLGTTLIGNNIANVTAAVLFTNYMQQIGLTGGYSLIGILFLTFVFLIFNDVIPKSFFRRFADTLAVQLSPLIFFFYILFIPIYIILNSIVKLILRIFSQHVSKRKELQSKRDLQFTVNLVGRRMGLTSIDQKMIEDIFDFREQLAEEVMTPLHKLPVISLDQNIKNAISLSLNYHMRFIPVSKGRTDNLIGYIDINEIMWKKETRINRLLKDITYYPDTILVPDLLLEMNMKKLDVVFLVDEYGGISGMVNPEQIVSEIFHHAAREQFKDKKIDAVSKDCYIIDGSIDLEDLENEIGLYLIKRFNHTLGGYICEKLSTIPEEGEVLRENNVTFKVLESDKRSVKKVELKIS